MKREEIEKNYVNKKDLKNFLIALVIFIPLTTLTSINYIEINNDTSWNFFYTGVLMVFGSMASFVNLTIRLINLIDND